MKVFKEQGHFCTPLGMMQREGVFAGERELMARVKLVAHVNGSCLFLKFFLKVDSMSLVSESLNIQLEATSSHLHVLSELCDENGLNVNPRTH